MKKVAILLADMFDENEFIYPEFRLKEDFEVHVIAAEAEKEYKGKSEVKKTSTHAAKDVKADDYAGVVIPGGFSPDYMRQSEEMKAFVKAMDEQKKPIAAICHAGWMLASCCDIDGKKVTSTPTIKDDMINAGGHWEDTALAVDGHLISSRKPADLPGFIKEFVKQVNGN